MDRAKKIRNEVIPNGVPSLAGDPTVMGHTELRPLCTQRRRSAQRPALLRWTVALAVTAMLGTGCRSAAARPATPSDLLAAAQRANPSCHVSLLPGTTRTGNVRGAPAPVMISITEISDCFGPGGTAYADDLTAIPADIVGRATAYAVDESPLENVKRADIENGVIVLEKATFAPGDPHCCPSRKARMRLVAQAGRLVPAP
jgi:hypothetical protein